MAHERELIWLRQAVVVLMAAVFGLVLVFIWEDSQRRSLEFAVKVMTKRCPDGEAVEAPVCACGEEAEMGEVLRHAVDVYPRAPEDGEGPTSTREDPRSETDLEECERADACDHGHADGWGDGSREGN